MQAAYDNGWIELRPYEGLYCVSCEAYYTEAELIDGARCPIHGTPVELLSEENYFFKLSEFTDRLLEWYEDNPGAVTPEAKRNEAIGLIKGGLRDISISRTSITWGVPVPWDPGHVFYVWYDALINYATAIGYGADPERFAAWWPAVHHLIGKDILRFHCVYWPALLMAAGIDPPGPHRGARLPAGRRREDVQVGAQPGSRRPISRPRSESTASATTSCATRPFGPDGDFSYEGMVARYNADLANNLGQPAGPGGNGGRAQVRRDRARARTRQPAGRGRGRRPTRPPLRRWDRIAPSEALEATWRLVRETNAALEAAEPWKAEPGPAVDAVLGDALEVLRIVAILASPALTRASQEIWRRIGLPGRVDDQRLPEAASVGRLSRWACRSSGATPLFPRITD